MPNQTFTIQPLLPPSATLRGPSYVEYLASYDMYVSKVQEIRTAAAAAKVAKVKDRNPSGRKPSQTPPALSEETRKKIGDAYAGNVKFGSLEFSSEELKAARKRWQTLNERGRARDSRPLNKKERAVFRKADQLRAQAEQVEALDGAYSLILKPALRVAFKELGLDGTLAAEGVGFTKSDYMGTFGVGTASPLHHVKEGMEKVAWQVREIVAKYKEDSPIARARLEKVEAESSLLKAERELKQAQTATQRNRAMLKRTVTSGTKAFVNSDQGRTTVLLVPESSVATESLLEIPAAAVATQQLPASLPLDAITYQGERLSAPTRVQVAGPGATAMTGRGQNR